MMRRRFDIRAALLPPPRFLFRPLPIGFRCLFRPTRRRVVIFILRRRVVALCELAIEAEVVAIAAEVEGAAAAAAVPLPRLSSASASSSDVMMIAVPRVR